METVLALTLTCESWPVGAVICMKNGVAAPAVPLCIHPELILDLLTGFFFLPFSCKWAPDVDVLRNQRPSSHRVIHTNHTCQLALLFSPHQQRLLCAAFDPCFDCKGAVSVSALASAAASWVIIIELKPHGVWSVDTPAIGCSTFLF